jgi:ribosomal protein S3
MGQKVNPIIFRIGICRNEWKSKYFEKNVEEHSLFSFRSVEIKKYLTKFLLNANLMLHDYRIYFTQTSFHIYISYFATYKIMTDIFKIKRKKIDGKLSLNQFKTALFLRKKPLIFNKYKKFLQSTRFENSDIVKKNSFLEEFLEGLSVFLFKKLKIVLILQQVRKGLSLNFNNFNSFDKIAVKNKLLSFRKHSKDPFFNDMLHLLIVSVTLKHSASLLSDYISYRLMKTKSHTQFLYTLRDILVTLQKTKISKIKGVKIKVKGRFNGKARSASKIIIIGEMPVQTLTEKIDYFESTSYTSNGTFGVKVWIVGLNKKIVCYFPKN